MCGIAIIIDFKKSNLSDRISDLTGALRHRGPDDEGFAILSQTGNLECWAGVETSKESLTSRHQYTPTRTFVPQMGQLSIGHRRLAIIDLSPSGHQPLCSSDGRYWISYNGEIYNYCELRQELHSLGYRFVSNTDTEALLAAYDCWGNKMLDRLVGMFSFAILDNAKKSMFIARDFFGIKPLYYWQGKEGLAFASEIKALLELPQIAKKVNAQRLYNYLLNGMTDNGSECLYQGINQVPPAHFIEVDLTSPFKTVHPQRYWSLEGAIDTNAAKLNFEQAAENLRHLFLESVRLHLRSDVPVGAALSGGIDSSSIFMAMRHIQGPNLELHAFSHVPDDESISEEKWIDEVAAAAKAHSHKVRPNSNELVSDIDALVRCQDEPFGSTSIYAQHRVFRLAREKGIKVMLDGQGADELLAGYGSYAGSRLASLVRSGHWFEAVRFSGMMNSNPQAGQKIGLKLGVMHFAKNILPVQMHGVARKIIGKPLVHDWMNQEWFKSKNVSMIPRPSLRGRNVLKANLIETLAETSLPALLRYEDRNSMAFSIESRVPFLTPKLVGFIYGLPEEYLIDNSGLTKAVFRRAMRGIVPDSILNRRDKIGFNTPEKVWLTNLKPWIEKVIESETAQRIPALKLRHLRSRWTDMLNGRAPFDFTAWRWVNLIRWAEINEVEFD